MDVMASKEGRGPLLDTIREIAEECFMPLCVGGGIRNSDDATACMDVGADKLCLTSQAMDKPELVMELARRFGSQAVVVGVDVIHDDNGILRLYDHRKMLTIKDSDPFQWASKMINMGCGEIRLMSVDREGTLQGYDLDLYQKMRELINVPIILEGGAGSLDHLEAAFKAGVDGVAVGGMLVFSDSNLVKIKQHMKTRKCNIRG
jgi:cyclase